MQMFVDSVVSQLHADRNEFHRRVEVTRLDSEGYVRFAHVGDTSHCVELCVPRPSDHRVCYSRPGGWSVRSGPYVTADEAVAIAAAYVRELIDAP